MIMVKPIKKLHKITLDSLEVFITHHPYNPQSDSSFLPYKNAEVPELDENFYARSFRFWIIDKCLPAEALDCGDTVVVGLNETFLG